MLVTDIVTEIQNWIDDSSASTRTQIVRWINWAIRDIIQRLPESDFLEDTKLLTIRPRIQGDGTAGNTCSVTKASRTVDTFTNGGSSNVFTVSYEGATIFLAGRTELYRIDSVDTVSSLTLDRPFEGATSATAAYDTLQDRYDLGTEVEEVNSSTRTTTPIRIFWWSGAEKDTWRPFPALRGATGTPFIANPLGRKTHILAASVGGGSPTTATVVDGSPTVTLASDASSTYNNSSAGSIYALLGSELVGAYLKLDRERRVYRIKKFGLSGTTTITLDENYQLPSEFTALSGLSWKIAHWDSIRVELYPLPTTTEQIQYRFHRRLFDIEDDTDAIPLPEKYGQIVQYGALYRALQWMGRADRAQLAKADYEQGIDSVRRDLFNLARQWSVQGYYDREQRLPSPVWPGQFGYP